MHALSILTVKSFQVVGEKLLNLKLGSLTCVHHPCHLINVVAQSF